MVNGDNSDLEVVDGVGDGLAAVLGRERHRQLARRGNEEIRGLVLVAVSVPAHHDRLRPGRHQAGNVLADDGLAEDGAAEDVANGAVGRAPHFLRERRPV